MSDDQQAEIVKRRKSQAAPPWVIWEALRDPSRSTRSSFWFVPEPGEVMPAIISSENPHTVEWSSIWEDHPDLRIRFEIEPDGPGSEVTWRLFARPQQLDVDDVHRRRHRLNELINDQLRAYFDL